MNRTKKHGMHTHPVYRVWVAMNQRCANPNNKSYPNYGGRGISVCDDWRHDFAAFYRDMGPRPEGPTRYTLERIDVNGDYEPGNCRWATYSEQNFNLRPRAQCRNGHPWTSENTSHWFDSSKGRLVRRCLTCRAIREGRVAA